MEHLFGKLAELPKIIINPKYRYVFDRVRRNVSVSTFVDRSVRQSLLGEESPICKTCIKLFVWPSRSYDVLPVVMFIVCELNRVTC